MKTLTKIWLTKLRACSAFIGAKVGLSIFLLSLFMYGQAASFSHAHEHHDDVPHKPCEVCILAVNDEDGDSDRLSETTDVPDVFDDRFKADVFEAALITSLTNLSFSALYYPEPHNLPVLTPELRSKLSRAPPLH